MGGVGKGWRGRQQTSRAFCFRFGGVYPFVHIFRVALRTVEYFVLEYTMNVKKLPYVHWICVIYKVYKKVWLASTVPRYLPVSR